MGNEEMLTRLFHIKRSVYQDLQRGIQQIQQWMSHAPEDAFYKLEEIRLRYRLTKTEKKLFDTYHLLGLQVLDHYQKALWISKEEREHLYRQIAALREDQKRIKAEMEELQSSRISSHEHDRNTKDAS